MRFVLLSRFQPLDSGSSHRAGNQPCLHVVLWTPASLSTAKFSITQFSLHVLPHHFSTSAGFLLLLCFYSLTFNDTIASPMPFIITLSPILSPAPCLVCPPHVVHWAGGSLFSPVSLSSLQLLCTFSFSCPLGPCRWERDSAEKICLFEWTKNNGCSDSRVRACFRNATLLGMKHLKHTYGIQSGVHLTT